MARPKKKKTTHDRVGRPAHFEDPEMMSERIDLYFSGGANTRQIITPIGPIDVPAYTITGLAYFLGFGGRQSFYDYAKKPEFSYILKKAALRVEQYYEECLQFGQQAGAIFALKNMGWTDKGSDDGSDKKINPIEIVINGKSIKVA